MTARPNKLLAGTVLAILLTSASSMAQDAAPRRMVILDRNLQRLPASLDRLTSSTVQYTDAGGRSRSIERSRVLAIYSARGHSASLPTAVAAGEGGGGIPGVLRLTDGQVLPGFLVTTDEPGEAIAWRSRRIGQFSIPLERALTMSFAETAHTISMPQRDTAILGNNDRIEGFVEGIGKHLAIEVAGQKTSIPIERVTSISLANPPAPGSMPLVFLSDGSALTASEFASSSPTAKGAPSATATAQWALASESGIGVVDLEGIDAIVFDPRAIVPLGSIDIDKAAGLDGRRWTPTPQSSPADSAPIGLSSITISGPAQVDWKLPAGTTKFGTSVLLPPDAQAWGNATVLVFASGPTGSFKEVAKADLSTEKPAADIVADITDARTLRVEVRAKAFSDVQARVILQQPVLMRTPEPAKK